jgi:hypothetical protein
MHLFLGSKDEIGVEIKVIDRNKHETLMGNAKLWFGGQFLGVFSDYIYLDGYLLGGLFQMLKVEELNDKKFPLESNAEYEYFVRRSNDLNDDEIDGYRVSFGTLADNFNIWAYREANNIVILWKLVINEGGFTNEDLINYRKDVFKYAMNYDKFKEFSERLERILNVW